MNESKTDPLSGLPQPNQGIKPSPLKDAGSLNESGGERWWLSDSVQPNELISDQSTHTEDAMVQPIEVSTPDASNADEVGADSSASGDGDSLMNDHDLMAQAKSSSGSPGLNLLIGAGLLGLILYLIFYGV